MSGSSPVPGFLPRQVAVDGYGGGGFRFAGLSHRGALLALPSGMRAWPAGDHPPISESALAEIIAEARGIDILLIGTGRRAVGLAGPVLAKLARHGLRPEVMNTGAAVRTYNVLVSEDRAVAGAFVAVD